MSHLRFLRKGDLRWPRENVITVAEGLFLIREWVIVRRPVLPACQKLRKKENNRLYRENNPECWENHYEQYVKPWRQRHPDYQRQWRQRRKRAVKGRSSGEIQAERLRKAIELTERTQLYLREIQAEIPLQVLPMAAKKASFPLQALR